MPLSPVIFGADGLAFLLCLVPALLYDLDELFGVVEQQLLVRGLAAGHLLAPALGPENQGPVRIRDPVPFRPLDLASGMGKKSGSGSGMNNPDHLSES